MRISLLNILEIVQSWYRVGFHTEEQKKIADERIVICVTCDQFTQSGLDLYSCNACHCPIKAKVYSPRGPIACPLGKWER